MRSPWFLLLLAFVCMAWVVPATVQEPPEAKPAAPSAREIAAGIATFLEAGARAQGEARQQQRAFLEQLKGLPELKSGEERSWRRKLAEQVARREKRTWKAGEDFWWSEPQRGRFLIGGRTSKPKGLLVALHGGGTGQADAAKALAFTSRLRSASASCCSRRKCSNRWGAPDAGGTEPG
ncbi:MAG: hypothetical protein R3F17_11660 [Planctomycetota bacterium]